MRPRARKDGLIVERLGGETLVYDLERHRAHCLNPTAAVVWDSCDGRSTEAQIARRVADALDLPDDAALVELALARLDRARLLDRGSGPPRSKAASLSRREAVRRLGLAAAAVPVVAGIVAPTAAQAATCLIDIDTGRPCAASQCGRECGGPSVCGTGAFFCKQIGGGNYRCVPPSAGTCP
ncbi:MAG TPA: PqqD family protein [Vicinamibacteria bacterium]|nr:PqqD family protein [Vicinamibacteria bacterium]